MWRSLTSKLRNMRCIASHSIGFTQYPLYSVQELYTLSPFTTDFFKQLKGLSTDTTHLTPDPSHCICSATCLCTHTTHLRTHITHLTPDPSHCICIVASLCTHTTHLSSDPSQCKCNAACLSTRTTDLRTYTSHHVCNPIRPGADIMYVFNITRIKCTVREDRVRVSGEEI